MRPALRLPAGLFDNVWANRLPLSICALALVVFSRSLFCGFVRDDHAQIVQNPQVQSWDYLPGLLLSHLWNQQPGAAAHHLFYRPLFSVWMLLVHTVGGLEPWFWHLASIVLHLAATWLVFRLCLHLTGSEAGAGVAAALFAVHPIHVDAVTWVSASNEVLFTVLLLGSLLLLLEETPGICVRLWPSAALFCAAMFSKETALAMLPVLIAVAWVRLSKSGGLNPARRIWNSSLPYLVATVLYALARVAATDRIRPENGEHSWAEVIFSSPSILLFYLNKLLLPLRLSPSYVNLLTSQPTKGFWFELLAVLLALALVSVIAIKYSAPIGLAAAWIVLPILPALAVLRIYPDGDMTHDRYLYAPSVGLSILVAMLVQHFWSKGKIVQRIVLAVAAVLICSLANLTFAQQRYYQDDLTFYQRAIQVDPANGAAYSAVGDIYLDQGRIDLALENHRKAHQVAPDNPQITLLLARALFTAKSYPETEALLNQLLQKKDLGSTHRISARLSLANLEIEVKNPQAAQALLQQVEDEDPNAPDLHWAKAVLFQREGLFPQAQAEYEREYQISGDPAAKRQSLILAKKNQRYPALSVKPTPQPSAQ